MLQLKNYSDCNIELVLCFSYLNCTDNKLWK